MKLKFDKYQGAGNDFVIVNNIDSKCSLTCEQIAWLCDRRYGIGADGLIILEKSEDADFTMKFYNSDGKTASMCGNGGRCIAKYAFDHCYDRRNYFKVNDVFTFTSSVNELNRYINQHGY